MNIIFLQKIKTKKRNPAKTTARVSFFVIANDTITYYSPLQPKAIVTCSFGLIAEIL